MEWLRKLLEGAKIVDGKLDIEALMKDVNTEFPKNAVPKETFNDINTQLKTANTTIEDLKKNNADNETLQQTIKAHEATIESLKNEALNTFKTYALKDKLKELGVKDVDYLIYKQGGLDKFNFDKDGKPVDVEDTIKPYKEDVIMAHLFNTGEVKNPYNPAGGGSPADVTKDQFEKMSYEERVELYNTNKTLYEELRK
ncbi:phage scaffolding protein [Clostridium tertium]|jgi:hypothetical protein|uniref:Phage scaffolding protein n=1 Tax=Clostridium tertium TaxID=1559 RepID=A0A9X3XSV4_9CLOT|nr:phage scaffolding protein [Clostridium tertium]MDC4242537.1 phage scaffolding protein [Clostridium tertium]